MTAAAAGALRLNEWLISRKVLGVENVVEMVTCSVVNSALVLTEL